MKKDLKFEEALSKLEEIVKQLESGEQELDKAIDKYTEAMQLVKFCSDKINGATEQVTKILNEDNKLEDFKVEDNES